MFDFAKTLRLGIHTEESEHMSAIEAALVDTNEAVIVGSRGGTIVETSIKLGTSKISLHGNTWHTYKLSKTYYFDQFSRLRFTMTNSDNLVGVCFTETEDLVHKSKTDGNMHCFNFSTKRTSYRWPSHFPEAYRFNLALGKPTFSSSYTRGGDPKYAVDDTVFTRFQSKEEKDPWLLVNLRGTYLIHDVVLYKNTNDITSLNNFTVSVLNDDNQVVFHDLFESSFQTEVARVQIPYVWGASIRVQVVGPHRILSLAQIQVYDGRTDHSPTWRVEVPVATFFQGRSMNYLTFLQIGDSVSELSDFELLFGIVGKPN